MISTLPLRRAHTLELDSYGHTNQLCHWLEMEHQYECVPSFKDIFDYYAIKNHWAKWIRPGMTCVDIGGHSGDTAIPMMVFSQGTVLTIEPNPTIRPYLELNCKINSHLGGKFVIASEAVTAKNVEGLEFKDHQNGMCNGGLVNEFWDAETQLRVAGMSGNSITVNGLTLSSMFEKYLSDDDIQQLGFIKTDTEGYDIEIIRNIQDILVKYKPVLFTEWFSQYSLADTKELFQVIKNAGYVAFNPYTMEPADPSIRSEDLVCLHQDNL